MSFAGPVKWYNITTMAEEIRVRFAPSPTGKVHIGNIRAAIYNWLYARHTGGRFLLRVECFNDWIKDRGGVKDLEPQKLLEQVRYYLELYSTSRFLDLNGMYRYITNKNGYKIKDEEGTWYFVYSKVFENEICAGFNFKQAKDILYKKGWLKDTKSETKHIRGDYERLYTLTPKIWSDEDINE